MAEFVNPFEEKKKFVNPFDDKAEFINPFESKLVIPDFEESSVVKTLLPGGAVKQITPFIRQIGGGIVDAFKELGKTVEDLTNKISIPTLLGLEPPTPGTTSILDTPEGKKILTVAFPPPKTAAESVTRVMSKFLAVFLPTRQGLLSIPKLAASTSRTGRAIKFFGPGVVADFTVFDPHEKRLSNVVEEIPALSNPFTRYLMAKPDDGRMEGRMKQVLEGAGFGGFIESFIRSARFVKAAFKTKEILEETGVNILSDNRIIQSIDIDAAKKGTVVETGGKKIIVDTNIAAAQASVPRAVAKGLPETTEVFTKEITVDATEKVIKATNAAVAGNLDESKRISKQVSEALALGEIQFDDVPRILSKYNLSQTEFAQMLVDTASFAGRILNRYSQIAKAAKKTMSPEAVRILEKAADGQGEFALDVIVNAIRQFENFRRGLLVTQLTTAVRNTLTQAPRIGLSVIDEVFQSTILGIKQPKNLVKLFKSDINALNSIWSSVGRGVAKVKSVGLKSGEIRKVVTNTTKELKKALTDVPEFPFGKDAIGITKIFGRGKEQVKNIITGESMVKTRFDEILDTGNLSLQRARLLNQPVHEVITANKGLAWHLNIFNRAQELFFRKMAFEAKLRQSLVRQGLNFDTIRPSAIPEKSVKEAVDYALEMTFAQSPKSNFMRSFIRSWNDAGLTTVNPFPRFAFANALPFVWEHSPFGLLNVLRSTKLANKLAEQSANKFFKGVVSRDPDQFARAASRTLIGTTLWMSAWHIRQSEFAGEKWYEIRFPDSEKTFDFRSYAPLSTSLFAAEAIMDIIRGTNKIKFSDYAQMIIGLNRISGSGLIIVDLFRAEKPETAAKILATFAGQYIGSFGVPARTVKDIVAQWSTEEAILRDVRQDPLWAPFINNFPIASRNLPVATSPFKEGISPSGLVKPIRIDELTFKILGVEGSPEIKAPLARQIFGMTARKKNPLEIEVDKLNVVRRRFYARTGNSKANRLVNGYMGYLSENYIIPFVESTGYKDLTIPEKRLQLRRMLVSMKKRAIKMFAANHTELALKLKFERMDDDVKEIIGITLRDFGIE